MRFDTDQLTDLLEVTAQATNLYVPAVIAEHHDSHCMENKVKPLSLISSFKTPKFRPKYSYSPQRKSSIRGEGLLRVRLSKAHCSRQRPL